MVITFASHAKGPWFETGRKQVALPYHPTAEICIHIGKGKGKARGEAKDSTGLSCRSLRFFLS